MAFETKTIEHTTSFNTVDAQGAEVATREIFQNIKTENLNKFEGFMLRNTFIASNDYSGGMNDTVSAAQVSQNNPAGSFRSLLTPKGDTMEMTAISSMADITFEKFSTDAITLEIDTYDRTPFKLLYAVDGAQGKGWLVDDIQSALSMQAISSLVRLNNFRVYDTIKRGALTQTDNARGTHGRVLAATASNEEFTDQLIDAVASYYATPEDRYVTGFDESELVIAITRTAHAQILKEKLVIYDGQEMGSNGKFYTGLPYTHLFAGTPLFVTRFLNRPEAPELDADYVILPLGAYSPFLYYIGRFAGRAEVAPFTDGALSVYGTMLSGMKVEEKLDQHITVKPSRNTDFGSYYFENNVIGLNVAKADTGALTLTAGEITGAFEYEVIDANTGAVVVTAKTLAAGANAETGLESGKQYLFKVTGGTSASPETKNGKANIYYVYGRA